MKRIIAISLAILASVFVYAQTSSGTWNSRTATYTNTAHKITWKLDDELTWVGRPILAESTLFKVRNDDTHILIKLGATKGGGANADAWDMSSIYDDPQYDNAYKAQAQQNGMTYLGKKVSKSQLSGIHAMKVRSDMKKYYPEYKQTVHSIEIMYQVCRRGYVYTATVTALSVLEEEIELFDRIATDLFKGLKIE